ncbi:molybdopterin-binding protein [Arcobacter sp. F2176]|uniref:TOBE domain-containing protein n=1 Tax=unclassified Arcobacter TaxID=2593671 RepID=UPI00100AF436|nr:TOBE domain-containing protein [Arcobacter sp. F2176]RXJ81577.1 transporter [Arcobacter sp. F2176]
MNKIEAIISQIDNIDNLNIVQFDFSGIKLKMMSLDLNENIKIGQKVILVAKATNIILARDFEGMISFSNQIKAKIESIEEGKLLCSVTIKAKNSYFQSIITQASAKKMNLKKDDEINIFIKASDLSIEEVINV